MTMAWDQFSTLGPRHAAERVTSYPLQIFLKRECPLPSAGFLVICLLNRAQSMAQTLENILASIACCGTCDV